MLQHILRVRDKRDLLEHPFITNGDARNVVRAVRLDRCYDLVALARVRHPPVGRDIIVSQEDRNIRLRLLNRLELRSISTRAEKGVRSTLPPGQTGYNQRRTGGRACK
jgi:hypothetical protein